MKVLLSDLLKNPKFRYMFGNFELDLTEQDITILNNKEQVSKKEYEKAITWFAQKGFDREIKMTYRKNHSH